MLRGELFQSNGLAIFLWSDKLRAGPISRVSEWNSRENPLRGKSLPNYTEVESGKDNLTGQTRSALDDYAQLNILSQLCSQ